MSYESLTHAISDTRQNLRAARRELGEEIKRCVENARGYIRLPDELTKLASDLASLDPQACGMSTAEYVFNLLTVYYEDLFQHANVGLDAYDQRGVTLIVRTIRR